MQTINKTWQINNGSFLSPWTTANLKVDCLQDPHKIIWKGYLAGDCFIAFTKPSFSSDTEKQGKPYYESWSGRSLKGRGFKRLLLIELFLNWTLVYNHLRPQQIRTVFEMFRCVSENCTNIQIVVHSTLVVHSTFNSSAFNIT